MRELKNYFISMAGLIRRNSRPHKILRTILMAGGILALSMMAPKGAAQAVTGIIREYFYKKRLMKEKFLRDLKNLQNRELIEYRELDNGEVKIILTNQGKKLMLQYNLDEIKLKKNKKWDGYWKMVIFDIPNSKKSARDAFRKKLSQLGLYSIQESVFITPFECGKEIEFICSIFDIRQHILIFYIKHFEGEEKFRHHFKV